MKIPFLRIQVITCALFIFSVDAAADSIANFVPLTYEANSTDVSPVNSPSTCTINITAVSDGRTNKESIGTEFKPIFSGDATPLMNAGLDQLKAFGFNVQRNAAPAADAINLDFQLFRAYTWHGEMRINGAIAANIGITPIGGMRVVQKLRASGSKTNMWSASSEYVTALNYAFNNMLNNLAVVLHKTCDQKSKLNQ